MAANGWCKHCVGALGFIPADLYLGRNFELQPAFQRGPERNSARALSLQYFYLVIDRLPLQSTISFLKLHCVKHMKSQYEVCTLFAVVILP